MVSLLALLCAVSQPGSNQSDWSGGPGVLGPFSGGFDSGFYSSEGMDWSGASGCLTLECSNVIESVSDAFTGQKAGIAAADVDSDGSIDIIFATTDPGGLGWFENSSSGQDWIRHVASTDEVTTVESGDFDGDGDPDALCSRAEAQVVAWYENNGTGSWTPHVIASGLSGACCAVAYDFEADGDLDVVACGFFSGISWFENIDGSGLSWGAHTVSESSDFWWVDAYNGDSDAAPEIYAICNASGGKYVVFFDQTSEGDWNWENIDWGGSTRNFYQVRVCDIDGDSAEDVLAGRTGYAAPYPDWGDLVYWYERGVFGWTETIIYDAGNGGHLFDGFEPADLDGDGTTDLLAWSYAGQNVTTLFNVEGDGSTWLPRNALSGHPGQQACCGDFDMDGSLEIAGALCDTDIGSLEIAELPWDTHPTVGTLESSIVEIPMGTDYVEWGDLHWDGWAPEPGSISMQVRASSDPGNMGEWSGVITSNPTPLSGILPNDGIYLQYRALFSAPAGSYSPVLDDVDIEGWVPGGIGESGGPGGLSVSVLNNPSDSRAFLRLCTPGCETAVLSIFDMAGRIVERADLGPLPSGTTMFTSGDCPAGIYHVLLEADTCSVSTSFVIGV